MGGIAGDDFPFGDAMKKSRAFQLVRWLSPFSPLMALGALIALPQLLNHPAVDETRIRQRNQQVVAAFTHAPWRIGQWTGEPVEVPNAGVEILRPNAILSRRFKNFNGNLWFTVMIIHCTDARDMEGHYPPVCYRANGWDPVGEPTECTVVINDQVVRPRVYMFQRHAGPGALELTRVFNFFVLPGGQITNDMDAVGKAVKSYESSIQGAAQILVAGPGTADFNEAVNAVGDLLAAHGDLLANLGREVSSDD